MSSLHSRESFYLCWTEQRNAFVDDFRRCKYEFWWPNTPNLSLSHRKWVDVIDIYRYTHAHHCRAIHTDSSLMLSRKRDENKNKKRTSKESNHDGQSTTRLIYIFDEKWVMSSFAFHSDFCLVWLPAWCVRVSHFICIHFSQDMDFSFDKYIAWLSKGHNTWMTERNRGKEIEWVRGRGRERILCQSLK